MSIQTLEKLLDHARSTEPEDDGFTEIVMQGIRQGRFGRGKRRRFVTRPALLATAAVLATGGALAAAVGTGTVDPARTPAPTTAVATAQPQRTIAASDPTRVTTGAGRVAPAARRAGQGSAPAKSTPTRRFANAFYEWGYTSQHTAYVLDKRSGLRFVTQTHSSSAAARRPRKVTLTVTNTTGRPVAVSSPSGCALSAAAWPGGLPHVSASATGRDPAAAKHWECAGGGSARNAGGEEFVLGPHTSRTQTVRLTLGAGRWAVAGVCRCTVVAPPDADDPMTLGRLHDLVITTQGAPRETRLIAPPLAIIAQ